MFGWGTLTGWTNAASPQLRTNASTLGHHDQTFGSNSSDDASDEAASYNGSGKSVPEDPSESGFGSGFGMDDEGSSWVGSSMAFGAILGSAVAGIVVKIV